MAGGVDHGNVQPRKAQLIPLAVGVGIVQRPRRQLGRHTQIFPAEVDLTPGFGGNVLYAAHMVKVPVGQQHGFHGQAQAVHLIQYRFRVISGVDNAAGFGAVMVDDIAVGLIRAQGQGVNVQHKVTSFV